MWIQLLLTETPHIFLSASSRLNSTICFYKRWCCIPKSVYNFRFICYKRLLRWTLQPLRVNHLFQFVQKIAILDFLINQLQQCKWKLNFQCDELNGRPVKNLFDRLAFKWSTILTNICNYYIFFPLLPIFDFSNPQ